jgi:hypothetical protein
MKLFDFNREKPACTPREAFSTSGRSGTIWPSPISGMESKSRHKMVRFRMAWGAPIHLLGDSKKR